jgi:hypothetical protein
MKHLDVLENAGLVTRSKSARTVTVRLRPLPMREALAWLRCYERFCGARVRARPAIVFDAVTTAEGIAHWVGA